MKKCPCGCGEVINLGRYHYLENKDLIVLAYENCENLTKRQQRQSIVPGLYTPSNEIIKEHHFAPAFMCENTLKQLIKAGKIARTSDVLRLEKPKVTYPWEDNYYDYYVFVEPYDKTILTMKEFFYENLEIAYKMEE